MTVRVYGFNHIAIEVTDIKKAIAFYEDVFTLKKQDEGEGDAFFQFGDSRLLMWGATVKSPQGRQGWNDEFIGHE